MDIFPTASVNVPPFYVALATGFLVVNNQGFASYTTNVRRATPFDTFEEADTAGRANAWRLNKPGDSYFAILCTPEGAGGEALETA
jgi:hypothetical protein